MNPLLDQLFDDAAIFPPAQTPVSQAVAQHLEHQSAWYAGTVGSFVCSDERLPELARSLPPAGLDVALVVTTGFASAPLAASAVLADDRSRLQAVEVPVAPQELSDAVHALDALPPQVRTFLELPLECDLLALHNTRHHAKFRTGPAPEAGLLAATLLEAVRWRVPFKLTAGLHHAIAGRAGPAGHGFLNVLLAVAQGLDGAPSQELAATLDETSADVVVKHLEALTAEQVTRVRRLFVSLGTCSISEPVADLVALGLLP